MSAINKKYFAFEHFESALKGWKEKLKSDDYTRALRKLKFMILGYAWVDFDLWAPETDRKLVMSYAWEDTLIAFSGYGQSGLTGVIIDVWSAVPKELWADFRADLNSAKVQAAVMTANTVPRRYLEKYRNMSVRTPQEGFDLPAIVPIWGPRLREWASLNGLDADETEAQMRLIEEYERQGLICLSPEAIAAAAAAPTPAPAPGQSKHRKVGHLTLVNTPKE